MHVWGLIRLTINNKIQKVPALIWYIHHLRHEDHYVSLRAYVQWHGVQMLYSQTSTSEVDSACLEGIWCLLISIWNILISGKPVHCSVNSCTTIIIQAAAECDVWTELNPALVPWGLCNPSPFWLTFFLKLSQILTSPFMYFFVRLS